MSPPDIQYIATNAIASLRESSFALNGALSLKGKVSFFSRFAYLLL